MEMNSHAILYDYNKVLSFLKKGFTVHIYRYTYCVIIIIIIIIIIDVSCHRPILPGNSLEPTVIPTAQASSFTLQYFPYYV
jgi:hypothetical protein